MGASSGVCSSPCQHASHSLVQPCIFQKDPQPSPGSCRVHRLLLRPPRTREELSPGDLIRPQGREGHELSNPIFKVGMLKPEASFLLSPLVRLCPGVPPSPPRASLLFYLYMYPPQRGTRLCWQIGPASLPSLQEE